MIAIQDLLRTFCPTIRCVKWYMKCFIYWTADWKYAVCPTKKTETLNASIVTVKGHFFACLSVSYFKFFNLAYNWSWVVSFFLSVFSVIFSYHQCLHFLYLGFNLSWVLRVYQLRRDRTEFYLIQTPKIKRNAKRKEDHLFIFCASFATSQDDWSAHLHFFQIT